MIINVALYCDFYLSIDTPRLQMEFFSFTTEEQDGDYEVTADMLIHEDVDDERTLEEDEDNQGEEGYQEELLELQKVI